MRIFCYNYIIAKTRKGYNSMKNIFITGVSSGLGEALCKTYLERGDAVYAIGRNLPKALDSHPHFFFFPLNLEETYTLKKRLQDFIQKRSFETAVLNAGVLGEIKPLHETELHEIEKVMRINVLANKEIIDGLSEYANVKQVVGISSGASVNGSKGWGAYSLSKAGLNMLLNVYAKELPEIHFTALAPGVIDTKMVRHIIQEVDEKTYSSVTRLREGHIQTPREAAGRLVHTFPKLFAYESGSFLDIRTMDEAQAKP